MPRRAALVFYFGEIFRLDGMSEEDIAVIEGEVADRCVDI